MADSSRNIIAGNIYDKEHTKNPVARWLIRNFDLALISMVEQVSPHSILEVGCGDGLILSTLRRRFPQVELAGMDLSSQIVRKAKQDRGLRLLACASAERLPLAGSQFDLVVCAEVLEHLFHPRQAIREAERISRKYVVISVPNEPIWRVMNMLRGAYWRYFGNTPGHIQHWRPKQFLTMLEERFSVVRVEKPFPWVMALCES